MKKKNRKKNKSIRGEEQNAVFLPGDFFKILL